MKTAWSVVVPPTDLLTIAAAKDHLRVDGTAEDALIEGYVKAARQHVEEITGCAIGAQTWEYQQEAWTTEFYLPGYPLTSVESIKYFDGAGVEQTLATTVYRVDTKSAPGRVEKIDGQSWPAVQAGRALPITVRYGLGYTAATLPAGLDAAMKLLVGHFYAHREAVAVGVTQTPLSFAVNALCGPYQAPWRPPRAA